MYIKMADNVHYLCSPYTHKNPLVMNLRYETVLAVATILIAKHGLTLIEPIAMSHEKAKRYTMPTDYAFWKEMNRRWILKCDGLIVVMLDGWKTSRGVWGEMEVAKEAGIPITYVSLDADHQPSFCPLSAEDAAELVKNARERGDVGTAGSL